jgi:hypothetical protein
MGDGFLVTEPVTTIAGLSRAQGRAIEAAMRCAPPAWHDNLVHDVGMNLPGQSPWMDSDVTTAIQMTLANVGLAVPFLWGPQQVYAAAMLSGAGTVAAAA